MNETIFIFHNFMICDAPSISLLERVDGGLEVKQETAVEKKCML